MKAQGLKIISMNVNGLNNCIKRKRVFHFLYKNKVDITCIQESHIVSRDKHLLVQDKLGQLFTSCNVKKTNGVLFYINRELNPEKIYEDQEGRILIVKVRFQYKHILLVGIYAPNTNQKTFYKKLSNILAEVGEKEMLWLGDFNGVMDTKIDRNNKRKKDSKEGRLPGTLQRDLKHWDLYDLWRIQKLDRREYSYYSHRHGLSSRIDYIFATKELVTKTEKVEFLPRVFADHNPMLLQLKGGFWERKPWRLNDYILKDQKIKEKIRLGIQNYIKENGKEDIAVKTVWDAGKAVIRGLLIQQHANWCKRKNNIQVQLLSKIRDKEKELEKSKVDRKKVLQELAKAQQQYELFLTNELERKIMYKRHNFFENANKPGRLLAWQVKDHRKRPLIARIRNKGKTTSNIRKIQKIFEVYYRNLYKNTQIDTKKIDQYLADMKVSKLSESMKLDLDRQITWEELNSAIDKAKLNKTPGPDGFSALFYKLYKEELGPLLLSTMNQVLLTGEMPESWEEATIVLLPKQDRDMEQVKNYRPISLVNNDYKLFAVILANRLKQILVKIIHGDQAGFLPGRHLSQNVRTVLNIIEYAEQDPSREIALLFLDAEKAFDNVRWEYMLKVLELFGVGQHFRRAIGAIYSRQRAKLKINDEMTNYIEIQKGTRQGCPLSPLLFIWILEILNIRIRETSEIKGVRVKGYEFKGKAYADDLVCFLREPLKSTCTLFEVINKFSMVSGFKINKEKSVFLTKNLSNCDTADLEKLSNCKVVPRVKYLGLWLTNKNSKLYQNNYDKTWKEIKGDLENWQRLQLTWLGRIAVIKMMVLPKMLFMFQNLPIIKGVKVFENWKKDLVKFIWNGKKVRIAYRNLIDVKDRGGLALPDLRYYYEAANFSWLKDWIKLDNKKLLKLEGHNLRYGWHAYLWDEKDKVNKEFKRHIIRSSLLTTWKRYKKGIEPKTPLWLRPLEAVLRPATCNEVGTYEEYLVKERGQWALKGREELGLKDWFSFYQLHDRFRKDAAVGFASKKSELECIFDRGNKGLLSRLYKFILDYNLADNQIKTVMFSWARDFGRNIDLEEWEYLWKKGFKFSLAGSIRENMFKMFYRTYITPELLAKIEKTERGACWRCKKVKGTFFHTWWTCNIVQEFWIKVVKETNNMITNKVKKNPETCLLGLFRRRISAGDEEICQYCFVAARLIIAKTWKGEEELSIRDWRDKLGEYIQMAKMTTETEEKIMRSLQINGGWHLGTWKRRQR
uniref:Reverse transcriptase domain-containing protein n=1 Tax=Anolis carolinensis TaxID=28377 RepID=A0A803TJL4_ANOCA